MAHCAETEQFYREWKRAGMSRKPVVERQLWLCQDAVGPERPLRSELHFQQLVRRIGLRNSRYTRYHSIV